MVITLREKAEGDRVVSRIQSLAKVRDQSRVIQRGTTCSGERVLREIHVFIERLNERKKRGRPSLLAKSLELILSRIRRVISGSKGVRLVELAP
jgi:hypothetical protein